VRSGNANWCALDLWSAKRSNRWHHEYGFRGRVDLQQTRHAAYASNGDRRLGASSVTDPTRRPRAGVLIWLLRGDGDTRREQPRLYRNRRVLVLEYGVDAGGQCHRDSCEAAPWLVALRSAAMPLLATGFDSTLVALRRYRGTNLRVWLTAVFWVLLEYGVMRSDELLRSSPAPGYAKP
jgi:hypothetical protein